MKLEYSRYSKGNFGDDINAWFWEEFAPGAIDDDSSTILLGIGTILSGWFIDKLPADSLKVVLGSGGGKLGGAPLLNERWRVYGVRGPLTASYSDLSPEMVLTDPAMLVRDLPALHSTAARSGVGFMPHIWSSDNWNWARTCSELGLVYVDPHQDSKETIRQISGLQRLVTEAMHGAIVADAMRTPWLAVGISRRFEALKWVDWGGSLGMPVFFETLPSLYDGRRSDLLTTLRARSKEMLWKLKFQPGTPPRNPSSRAEIAEAKMRLKDLAWSRASQLSEPAKLEGALARTRKALDRFRGDVANGVFP